MIRIVTALVLSLGIASAAAAQDKPTPAMETALTGKWTFDQSRSDSVGSDTFYGGFRGAMPVSGASAGGSGGSGGGGRGGGKKGNAAPIVPPSDTTPTAPQPDRNRPHDPKMEAIIGEAMPAHTMIIAVNDSAISMATGPNQQSAWKTDGKKRQDAQMDGSVEEIQGGWKDGTLTLIHGIAGSATLKRDFKVSKDGNTLEVKESLDRSGNKVDKKLVFTRAQ